MPSFKKILFPLNGSRDSLDYAIMMAKKNDAKLFVLKTYRFRDQISVRSRKPTEVKASIRESIQKEFDEKYKFILEGAGLDYEFNIEIGFLTDRISEAIKDNSIDILLLNTLESSGDENMLEKLNQLKIPVMLIPEKNQLKTGS